MADRPVKELGGFTPLEIAHKPFMSKLAKEGECGIMDPIAPGIRAGSDTAHLALLGYDPYKYYTGRGAFEAAGIGLNVEKGDICFRCNFATVDEDTFIVMDRRAGRIREGTHLLAQALDGMEIEGVKIFFKESVEHRAGLVLRGEGLGHNVSDADPHKEGEKVHTVEPLEPEDITSQKTAQIVNEFVRRSFEILRNHPVNLERKKQGLPPANIVLPRGAGTAPHIPPFQERYGLSSACIVEVGLLKGVGRYLKMDVIDVEGATGSLDTDEQAIARAVISALSDHDFVLCNVKAPDVAGHDGEPYKKIEAVEKIDRMVGTILSQVTPEEVIIVLTADHSTPISVKDHSGDSVPIVFWGEGVRTDDVDCFGERSCASGGLGRIKGIDIMNILTNLLSVQEKFGA
jgi:2,3-bisphosphoglycerate-independent phosphoglycerate mutase